MNIAPKSDKDNLPGKGLLGWLGRQVGHVKRALHADVTSQVIYRDNQIAEAAHPAHPNLTLRRTITDEVIVRQGAQTTKRVPTDTEHA